MFRKITIIHVLSILSVLFSVGKTSFADEEEEVFKAKESICTLIDAGKFAEAKSAAEKMAVEFAGQAKLPEMLYWVAERYERNDQFVKAQLFYQRVIQDYPQNQYKDKARLNAAKSEIMALIMAGRYDEAHAALDKYIIDFASHLDLPRSLFFIAERYQRVDKFDEAKQIYQRIVENYPNNSYVNRARLWLSRTNVSSLIVSGNYAGAQETLDKFVADFNGSGDLQENLFWITERYERQVRFEDARQNYQRIIQNFPYSSWARRAKLGIPRAEAIYLIESGAFNQADAAINKMAGDFAKHSDMPWSLYLIAERYKKANRSEDVNRIYQQIMHNYPDSLYANKVKTELGLLQEQETQNQFSDEAEKNAVELYRLARQYEDSNDVASAKQTYERVINEYPGTIKANNAPLDIRRLAILDKLGISEINQAEVLIDGFITDFNEHPYLPAAIIMTAESCSGKFSQLQMDGRSSRPYLEMALKMLDIIINRSTLSQEAHGALRLAGDCHYKLGNYQQSADAFQKVVDNYPNYELAWHALFMTGRSYDSMSDFGFISKEAAALKIKVAYEQLLERYPACPAAKNAQDWINSNNSR